MATEYQINNLITLKLEDNRTNIYVNGEPFNQCKYLLLNLSQKDFKKFEDIESIDEAFKIYNQMDKEHERNKMLLDSQTEFIGHCSNLQAWVEHDYDLRILHSSLSFPLLNILSQYGDNKAKIVLKEEIARRISSNNLNTIRYFLEEKYLFLYEIEELEVLFERVNIEDQDLLKKINSLINQKRIINKLKKKKSIKIDLGQRGWNK